MEIDNGASTVVIDEETFNDLSQQGRMLKLNAMNMNLFRGSYSYRGEL